MDNDTIQLFYSVCTFNKQLPCCQSYYTPVAWYRQNGYGG